MLYNLDNEQILIDNPEAIIEDVEMTEEDCARRQAQETDYMMQLLIENLELNGFESLGENEGNIMYLKEKQFTQEQEIMPAYYSTGTVKYDSNQLIDSSVKNVIDNPNTGDSLYLSIGLFITSLVAVVLFRKKIEL